MWRIEKLLSGQSRKWEEFPGGAGPSRPNLLGWFLDKEFFCISFFVCELFLQNFEECEYFAICAKKFRSIKITVQNIDYFIFFAIGSFCMRIYMYAN